MLTVYGAAAEIVMWAVLQGDNSRRIPGPQVPETSRSLGPVNPGDGERRKGEEKGNKKERSNGKRNRTKKRVQEDTERREIETGTTKTEGQGRKNNRTRNLRNNKRNCFCSTSHNL